MPRPSKARKVDEAQRERLVEHLSGIPPADAAIMAAGALAGTKGYTPMTMLIKGLTSGGNGLANDALNVVDNIMNNKWVQMTPAGMVYDYNVRITRLLSDVILGPPADRPTHNTYSPGYVPPVTGGQYSVTPIASKVDWDHYYKLAALASVGMVEAYMITRPGAFGAVLNMIQTGVSGIAGAAKVGAALLGQARDNRDTQKGRCQGGIASSLQGLSRISKPSGLTLNIFHTGWQSIVNLTAQQTGIRSASLICCSNCSRPQEVFKDNRCDDVDFTSQATHAPFGSMAMRSTPLLAAERTTQQPLARSMSLSSHSALLPLSEYIELASYRPVRVVHDD